MSQMMMVCQMRKITTREMMRKRSRNSCRITSLLCKVWRKSDVELLVMVHMMDPAAPRPSPLKELLTFFHEGYPKLTHLSRLIREVPVVRGENLIIFVQWPIL